VRYVIVGCVVVAIAAAIFWLTRAKSSPATVARPVAGSAVTPASSAPAESAPPAHVRQLDAPARKQLRAQIAAARAKARAAAPSSPSSVPAEDPAIPLEEAGPIVEALQETPALMAKCYGDQPEDFRALARLTILSDPELGAVVDTDNIVDKDGKPIDAKIEACMRDTIESLALPPMAKPGRLQLEYTFRF
jgi:hypothetical protein